MTIIENTSLPDMGSNLKKSEETLRKIHETNNIGFSDLLYDPLQDILECLRNGFTEISQNNFKSRIEEEIRIREKKVTDEKVKKAEESVKKEKDPKKTDRDDISRFLKTGNIFQDTLTGITRGIKDDIMDFTDMEVVSGIKINQIFTPLEKLKDSLDARSEDQILNDKIVDKLDEIKEFQEALDPDKGKSFTDEERKIAESNLEVAKKQLELLEGQKKSQTQQQEESLFKTNSEKVKDAVVSEDGKTKDVPEIKDGEGGSFKIPTIQEMKDKFQSIRMGIAAISATLTSLSSGFISLLGPFAPIIGTIAAIAYVGYALYQSVTSMFDVFEETGSIMESLKVGISTFLGTLIALPFDLIKGAISYIADFLGFEKFSKILDSFSFVEILTNAYKNLLDWIQFGFEWLLDSIMVPVNLFIDGVKKIVEWVKFGFMAYIDFIMVPFNLFFDGIKKIFEGDFAGGLKDIYKGVVSIIFWQFRAIVDIVDSIFGTDISSKISNIFDGMWDTALATLKGVAGAIMGIFDFDWMSMLKKTPIIGSLLDKMGIGGKEEGGPKVEQPPKSESSVLGKVSSWLGFGGNDSDKKPEKEGSITNARRFFLDNQHLLTEKNLGVNLNEKEGALKESNMQMNSPKQSKGDVAVINDSSTKSNSQFNITKEVKAPSIGRSRYVRGSY